MKKIEVSSILSKENKELLFFLALIVVIIIVDFSLVLKKQWAHLLSVGPQISQARQHIKESSADASRLEMLKKRLEEISNLLVQKKSGIVEETQIPAIMGEISKLADKVSLKIMQIRPLPETRRKGQSVNKVAAREYYVLPIAMITKGDYHSFGKFVDELEKSPFYVKIENIDITPQLATPLVHDIRLSISIFIVKGQPNNGK